MIIKLSFYFKIGFELQSINETLEQKVLEKIDEVRQLASDVIHAT
jgi:hypothetical protein